MKTVRRLLPLTLAALLLAGPLAAALPDAEMAGADGPGLPASAPEKKPTPRSGAAARKHHARSQKRAPHDAARGASTDRSSSLAPRASARDSASRPS
ncbi:MAG TPA: hypothetical protein VMQ61_04125 [Thermoanaerobaculia bacterium]|nr:hypothetical protein [Thermoanaerobaculia bacterium]